MIAHTVRHEMNTTKAKTCFKMSREIRNKMTTTWYLLADISGSTERAAIEPKAEATALHAKVHACMLCANPLTTFQRSRYLQPNQAFFSYVEDEGDHYQSKKLWNDEYCIMEAVHVVMGVLIVHSASLGKNEARVREIEAFFLTSIDYDRGHSLTMARLFSACSVVA